MVAPAAPTENERTPGSRKSNTAGRKIFRPVHRRKDESSSAQVTVEGDSVVHAVALHGAFALDARATHSSTLVRLLSWTPRLSGPASDTSPQVVRKPSPPCVTSP